MASSRGSSLSLQQSAAWEEKHAQLSRSYSLLEEENASLAEENNDLRSQVRLLTRTTKKLDQDLEIARSASKSASQSMTSHPQNENDTVIQELTSQLGAAHSRIEQLVTHNAQNEPTHEHFSTISNLMSSHNAARNQEDLTHKALEEYIQSHRLLKDPALESAPEPTTSVSIDDPEKEELQADFEKACRLIHYYERKLFKDVPPENYQNLFRRRETGTLRDLTSLVTYTNPDFQPANPERLWLRTAEKPVSLSVGSSKLAELAIDAAFAATQAEAKIAQLFLDPSIKSSSRTRPTVPVRYFDPVLPQSLQQTIDESRPSSRSGSSTFVSQPISAKVRAATIPAKRHLTNEERMERVRHYTKLMEAEQSG
ncbi:MAG: hypothetical protein Q9219_002510 [cf. Caloplaca sp. 3 TL-2023]